VLTLADATKRAQKLRDVFKAIVWITTDSFKLLSDWQVVVFVCKWFVSLSRTTSHFRACPNLKIYVTNLTHHCTTHVWMIPTKYLTYQKQQHKNHLNETVGFCVALSTLTQLQTSTPLLRSLPCSFPLGTIVRAFSSGSHRTRDISQQLLIVHSSIQKRRVTNVIKRSGPHLACGACCLEV